MQEECGHDSGHEQAGYGAGSKGSEGIGVGEFPNGETRCRNWLPVRRSHNPPITVAGTHYRVPARRVRRSGVTMPRRMASEWPRKPRWHAFGASKLRDARVRLD